jgi:outer membrane protein OmpA-like peptidoglycan-associated protein
MLSLPSLRCRIERRNLRRALPLVLFVVLTGLAACSPIQTWRNLTGASKNDPNPKTTPNTKNLEAGAEVPYPNLATVPPPPTGGLTEAQLEKLTKSLIADNANAKYNTEKLRGGFAAGPPPPAPGPVAAAAPASAAKPSASAGLAAGAAAAPAEQVATAPAGPVAGAAAAPAEQVATAPAGPVAGAAAAPAEQVTASPAGAGPTAPAKKGKLPTGRRKPGEPPQPGPMESSLTMPRMASMPPPEAVEPAPPAPHLLAPEKRPAPVGTLASLPPSARYEPPPPAPDIAPPPKAAAAKPAKPAPKGGVRLAAVMFPSQSTTLSGFDQQQLAAIVPFYKLHPGIIRVVGYAGAAGGGTLAQLNSFSAALDRAQAVAAVLTKAGIPAAKIKVEAAPTTALGPPRAEVLLEPAG